MLLLFSSFWCNASPYNELKRRNVVRQMDAATMFSAQIPPFSSADRSHPPVKRRKKKYMAYTIGYNGLQAITRVMHSNRQTEEILGSALQLLILHT